MDVADIMDKLVEISLKLNKKKLEVMELKNASE